MIFDRLVTVGAFAIALVAGAMLMADVLKSVAAQPTSEWRPKWTAKGELILTTAAHQ